MPIVTGVFFVKGFNTTKMEVSHERQENNRNLSRGISDK